MQAATTQEILEVATRMAQELQEFIDDARESGSDLPATTALLNDWEEVFKRTTGDWRFELAHRNKVETNPLDNYTLDLAPPSPCLIGEL